MLALGECERVEARNVGCHALAGDGVIDRCAYQPFARLGVGDVAADRVALRHQGQCQEKEWQQEAAGMYMGW